MLKSIIMITIKWILESTVTKDKKWVMFINKPYNFIEFAPGKIFLFTLAEIISN